MRKKRSGTVTDGLIFRYLEGLATPRSLAVWILYKNREHQQLVDLDVNYDVEPYLNLRSVDVARRDYLATEFLSKADFLDLKINRKKVAIQKFLESEDRCKLINSKLLKGYQRVSTRVDSYWLLSVARKKIADILGSFDPEEFIRKVSWGPGATAGLIRSLRLKYDKFRLDGGVSATVKDFWEPIWDVAFPRWRPDFEVQTAYVHTVPKNSKTDRVIIIEPGVNTFLQKGLGSMIRSRLTKVGIDLGRQADLHRTIICDLNLATVDFSAASDSISIELVRELLPDDWFKVLDIHRSKCVDVSGNVTRLEKFSSMGNGFTFELETLIFYALAYAVCERGDFISVFGDDVIMPATRVLEYRDLCNYCGLRFNPKKSFSEGYFRESCGEHLFSGHSAKPFYLRSRIRSRYDIIKAANQLRRLAHRMCNYHACDSRIAKAWGYITGASVGRLFNTNVWDYTVSDGFGDVGIICNFDEATPIFARDYQRGFFTRGVSFRYEDTRLVDDDPLLITKLFELERQEVPYEDFEQSVEELAMKDLELNGNELPDLSSGIVTRVIPSLYIPQWYNLGPWV